MSDQPEQINEAIRGVLGRLSGSPDISAEEVKAAEEIVQSTGDPSAGLPENLAKENVQAPISAAGSEDSRDIRSEIAEMGVPQKIKLALFGNAVCRAILIMDGSRMIQQFVLKNPKLQGIEVEAFARNPNMSETVLRSIAESKVWMKNYSIKLSIVSNPRTPGDVALKWLRYLQDADIKKIARSKNLPQLVVNTAKKRLADIDRK
ncbi:MAG: hypothetical protein K1X79_11070 [Oligoflexia bacterium]|nr:hypothetical protein [Oligoflexia bacterium]